MENYSSDLMLVSDFKLTFDREASDLLKSDYWRVDESNLVTTVSTIPNNFIQFVVSNGFLTDGCSVPRILHPLIPKWDETTNAVIIHDWLLEHPEVREFDDKGEFIREFNLTRKEIDNLFYKHLIVSGVGLTRAKILYLGVSIYTKIIKGKLYRQSPVKVRLEQERMYK